MKDLCIYSNSEQGACIPSGKANYFLVEIEKKQGGGQIILQSQA